MVAAISRPEKLIQTESPCKILSHTISSRSSFLTTLVLAGCADFNAHRVLFRQQAWTSGNPIRMGDRLSASCHHYLPEDVPENQDAMAWLSVGQPARPQWLFGHDRRGGDLETNFRTQLSAARSFRL